MENIRVIIHIRLYLHKEAVEHNKLVWLIT